MPLFQLELTDAEWEALRADYARVRARGWAFHERTGTSGLPDEAGHAFARAAMMIGARVLATRIEDVIAASRVLRQAGRVPYEATDGEAAATSVGTAIELGFPRLLGRG